jgi:hypothetical protein
VHRHKRGGAGGVDRDRRALQAEGVGDAATDDRGGHPRGGAIGAVPDPGKDAGLGLCQGGGVDAGVLQGLPGRFEQEALLGVHHLGLARADRKEVGVKGAGCLEEAALFGIARAGVLGIGVVEAVDVPAAVGGELGDAVAALGDQLPELGRGGDPTGVAAGHADDRDRL